MTQSSPLTIVAIATAIAGQEKALRIAQEKLVQETLTEPGACDMNSINRWTIRGCSSSPSNGRANPNGGPIWKARRCDVSRPAAPPI